MYTGEDIIALTGRSFSSNSLFAMYCKMLSNEAKLSVLIFL